MQKNNRTSCSLDPGVARAGFAAGLALIFLLPMPAALMAADLAGSEWQPTAGSGTSHGEAYIQFQSHGRVAGRSGCNRFSGKFKISRNGLRIGPLMSTRMACAPKIMRAERDFLRVMNEVRAYRFTRLKLVLRDGADNNLVTLQRRDFD